MRLSPGLPLAVSGGGGENGAGDDHDDHLGQPRPFDQLVDLPHRRVAWQVPQVRHEVVLVVAVRHMVKVVRREIVAEWSGWGQVVDVSDERL